MSMHLKIQGENADKLAEAITDVCTGQEEVAVEIHVGENVKIQGTALPESFVMEMNRGLHHWVRIDKWLGDVEAVEVEPDA